MGETVIKPQAQIILERGIEQGKRETVFGLAEMGMPLEQIAQAVKIGVDTVRQWLEGGADQADMSKTFFD